jgi:two-component system CheB/CheR fusion protein
MASARGARRAQPAPPAASEGTGRPATTAASTLAVVAIGASAGGLEAIEAVLAAVPSDAGAAWVVVQHLDPTRPAALVELLRRSSTIPVVEIEDGMPLRADHVHVLPPGRELTVVDGILHLLAPAAPRGHRLPIDAFFHALARDRGAAAVALVLSGMGADGLLGAESVRELGGFVAVQDPATARFDSMPRAVIDGGVADLVAPASALAGAAIAFLRHGIGRAPAMVVASDEAALDAIAALLHREMGNDVSRYKRTTLQRRVTRRMALRQCDSLRSYLQLLEASPPEVGVLARELLIGVTSFFRDPATWLALRDHVLPGLLHAPRPGRALRLWVPACSTGEEAYTLAMIVREALDTLRPAASPGVQCFATDLNADAIAVARSGCYPRAATTAIDDARRERFFAAEGDGWRVRHELRAMVTFAAHDVLRDPPFTRLDVVSCRNLLIYLTPDAQRTVLEALHYALAPGGILVLGTAESAADVEGLFEVVDASARIYRRRDRGRVFPARHGALAGVRAGARDTGTARPPSLHAAATEWLLARLDRAALLVDAQGEIVWLGGRAHEVLVPATGGTTWHLAAMLPPALAGPVLEAVDAARAATGAVLATPVPHPRRPDTTTTIEAEALREPAVLAGLVLVRIGRRRTRRATTAPTTPPDATTPTPGAALRRARADAAAARAALQAAREELGSALEEMQSTNEELQSTNEELTTSTEELQSMNEELQTINMEQVARLELLAQAQADMDNLLDSTELATLFLGPGLALRRFTRGATRLYRLLPGDLGRPITDLVSELAWPALADDVASVRRTLVPVERELVSTRGEWFLVRVLPYRTLDDRIDGAVITFADVSAAKQLEHRLRALVAHAPVPLLELDAAGRMLECSAAAAAVLGHPGEALAGRLLAEIAPTGELTARITEALREAAAGRATAPFTTHAIAGAPPAGVHWIVGPRTGTDEGGIVLVGHPALLPTPEPA